MVLLAPLGVRLASNHIALADLAGQHTTPPSTANTAAQPRAEQPTTTASEPPPTPMPLDEPSFAPGACIALGPLHGNRHRTVYLDAGHGGPDPGAVGTTSAGQPVSEKQLTLPVAVKAASLLREAGFRVVLSRTQDSTVGRAGAAAREQIMSVDDAHSDHLARVNCANLARANVLVSIHFNAFDDGSEGGATTVYDPSRPFSAGNQQLATELQRRIVASFAAKGWRVADRGIDSDEGTGGPALSVQGAAYGHLIILGPAAPGYVPQPSAMPGALVEPLFITKPAEATLAASPQGQQAIAEGIAQAVEQFERGH